MPPSSLILAWLAPLTVMSAIPTWEYKGYESFPAMVFGGNVTAPGLNSEPQLRFDTRHQLVGTATFGDEGMKKPEQLAAAAAGNRSGYITPAEEWQAANFRNLEQFAKTTPGAKAQGFYAYRQAMYALYYFNSTNYFLDNPSLLWHDDQDRICWYEFGALYNFSAPGFEDAFMEHVIEEICDEAGASGINAVFFDGVDGLGIMPPRGAPFGTNCSMEHLNMNDQDFLDLMKAQAKVFARAAVRLNSCGVWPMYSFGGAIDEKIAKNRGYPASETVALEILASSNATWSRYYEYWQVGAWGVSCGYNIENALVESRMYGVPLTAHAYPAGGGAGGEFNTSATYSVAAFLIVQSDYSYYGISSILPACKGMARQWSDCGYVWHDEYDMKYGKPLGAAKQISNGVWIRDFENAIVMVDENRSTANITVLDPPRQFLYGL